MVWFFRVPLKEAVPVQTFTWTGKSGLSYQYQIYPMGTSLNDLPGNYVFARESSPNRWAAVYIGQTENLRTGLPRHGELPGAIRDRVTHIHVHLHRGGELARRAEETDLLAAIAMPCNRRPPRSASPTGSLSIDRG